MTDKEISELSERDFDLYLEDITDRRPPDDLADDLKPWRKAMNRILWGTGLTTVTLNFWNLDLILPAIGMILLLLGFRALRRENKWFRIAYITSCFRTVEWLLTFALRFTIYMGEPAVKTYLATVTYVMLALVFLTLVCLRGGIRGIQTKAGLPAHGGDGLLVWYLVITALGFINYSGIAAWGLLIAYALILRNLYKLSKELDEAGYTVSPAPVKISDNAVKLIYVGVIVLAMVIGYCFFSKYPMDWRPVEKAPESAVQEVRQELLALGFPENVLNDMSNEEILACDGAVFVLVDQRDHDMDRGRGIGTQEEIDSGKVALLTEDEGERQLRTTYVGVKFGDERERWQIIHHFEWLVDVSFCGTESIQLRTSANRGWELSADFTGRLLYDSDGSTYTSDYYSLGWVSYEGNGLAVQMLRPTTSNDVFANFSMPDEGSRKRGYVIYELSVQIPGTVIDSWLNYTHQYSLLQFPVETAMEHRMKTFGNDGWAFQTTETALQFFTHGEIPELF